MIEEINKILRETAFPNRQCNLLMLLCIILSFTSPFPSLFYLFSPEPGKGSVSLGPLFAGMFLPYVLYFSLMIYKKISRKSNLLNFVQNWNKKQNTGVFISLGGGGNVRGMAVGSETGGTYEHFHMATWDPKSLLIRGYLHLFVNYQERANWCQRNGVPFIPPVPPHQQTMEQQIAPQTQDLTVPSGYQIPAGFALVPQNYQPPQNIQVPAGYALVPQAQDLPPDYDQARQM